MTQDRASTLRDGLQQQVEIYEVLATLTCRQHEVLIAGDLDEIVQLVAAKEHELERIEAIDQCIAPLKESWKSWRGEVEEGLGVAVDQQLNRLSEVLEQLIELERDGQARFEDGKRLRAEALRKIEGGRRVNKAYGATQARGSGIIDQSH